MDEREFKYGELASKWKELIKHGVDDDTNDDNGVDDDAIGDGHASDAVADDSDASNYTDDGEDTI